MSHPRVSLETRKINEMLLETPVYQIDRVGVGGSHSIGEESPLDPENLKRSTAACPLIADLPSIDNEHPRKGHARHDVYDVSHMFVLIMTMT